VLDVERWAELRREHFVRGVSIRKLVRRTGLARNTVRAALRSDEPPAFRCPERSSKLDPFKEEIPDLRRSVRTEWIIRNGCTLTQASDTRSHSAV